MSQHKIGVGDFVSWRGGAAWRSFYRHGTVTRVALIELRGAGGEPIDLRRTLGSHGVAELPPTRRDGDGLLLNATPLVVPVATAAAVAAAAASGPLLMLVAVVMPAGAPQPQAGPPGGSFIE